MLWRGLSVGPVLGSEVRVGIDRANGQPVALRWFASRPAVTLPPLPWPPEPHPNVARVLRAEPSHPGVVLVSELSLGPTLEQLARSPQPPPVVAGLSAQLLTGLEALHRAGRPHGRLHPGNLVLDVRASSLRIHDVCAAAFEGVPHGGDLRKLFARPGSAEEGPSVAGDLYAAGRVAEALLRGGPPRLGWEPLPESRDQAVVRIEAWIARCQSLDPATAFVDAAAARAALSEIGTEGGQSFAQVPAGAWLFARRRAERALAAWKRSTWRELPGPEDFADLMSSQRASVAWRRLGAAACAALLLSAALATRTGGEADATVVVSTASRAHVDALRDALAAAEADAGAPPADPLERALVDPAAPALLAAADRSRPDGGAAAALPSDLEGPLRELRDGLAAFREASVPCEKRLESAAASALGPPRPDVGSALRAAVPLLAVQRLTQSADAPDEESRTRAALGVPDSPLLDRAVERVAGDAEVGACVRGLAERAQTVAAALARSREPIEEVVSDGPAGASAGSAP